MTFVSLSTFQRITGISDRALIRLLEDEKLDCKIEAEGGIQINADSVEVSSLIKAMASQVETEIDSANSVIMATFSRILSEEIDGILDEALTRLRSEPTSGS